jgi:glycine/D-amino acid oxidase-like deaminating enzyme
VVLATGFSGHGFKFVSAMGEILAQMIIGRKIAPETKFLGIHRFVS